MKRSNIKKMLIGLHQLMCDTMTIRLPLYPEIGMEDVVSMLENHFGWHVPDYGDLSLDDLYGWAQTFIEVYDYELVDGRITGEMHSQAMAFLKNAIINEMGGEYDITPDAAERYLDIIRELLYKSEHGYDDDE